VGLFVQTFVGILFAILWLLVLGRIVMSWIDPAGRTRLGALLVRFTEPLLAPVRRLLPPTGMLDLSSLVLLLVLGAIWRAFL
jgi:YggT family protein